MAISFFSHNIVFSQFNVSQVMVTQKIKPTRFNPCHDCMHRDR
uniref:Uncharacterized protein n=1 Tax=Anguilla anguilla TaxID=7936 RepID=A0A0E9WVP4_ANGAN